MENILRIAKVAQSRRRRTQRQLVHEPARKRRAQSDMRSCAANLSNRQRRRLVRADKHRILFDRINADLNMRMNRPALPVHASCSDPAGKPETANIGFT